MRGRVSVCQIYQHHQNRLKRIILLILILQLINVDFQVVHIRMNTRMIDGMAMVQAHLMSAVQLQPQPVQVLVQEWN